jgi:hypothetical protein
VLAALVFGLVGYSCKAKGFAATLVLFTFTSKAGKSAKVFFEERKVLIAILC